MNFLKTAFDMLKETFSEWNQDKAPRLAAALAYYTAFSIAPLLVIVIAVAGLAFGQSAAQGEIMRQIENEVGAESAQIIQTMIENASDTSSGIIATVLGIGAIIFGAAGFFGQLQDALNTIWDVAPKPGRGIMAVVKDRFMSFTMVLGIGFLLLVSLLISALVSSLHNYVEGLLPQAQLVSQIINNLISFGIITLLFAMIYKILPDVEIEWRDVWVGAAITALLFTIGKFLLGLYLGNSGVASTYGVAGSFVVLLLWVYYSAQILLFGAEFTQVYARRRGARIQPADNAVPISEVEAQTGTPATPSPGPTPRPAATSPAARRSLLPARVATGQPVPTSQEVTPAPVRERRWSAFWIGLAAYNMLVAAAAFLTVGRKRLQRGSGIKIPG